MMSILQPEACSLAYLQPSQLTIITVWYLLWSVLVRGDCTINITTSPSWSMETSAMGRLPDRLRYGMAIGT